MDDIRVIDVHTMIAKELYGYFPDEEIKALQRVIFEKTIKLPYHLIFINREDRIKSTELDIIYNIIGQLKSGTPIQYILGETDFFGLTIKVNRDVLIPRPETEELVDLVLKSTPDQPLKILDIGTGSGCIAISLAKNHPDFQVYGMDISGKAITLADENAHLNGVNVNFFQSDILNLSEKVLAAPFDIIVSNPPYVRESESLLMQPNVLDYEPHQAIFVKDTDPFIFYIAISQKAGELLVPGGRLFCEINEAFGSPISAIFKENNFVEVRIYKDINGKDRIISARYGEKR